MDINNDGRVGGSGGASHGSGGGITGQIEKGTHTDLNHDGVVGGQRAPGGSGGGM